MYGYTTKFLFWNKGFQGSLIIDKLFRFNGIKLKAILITKIPFFCMTNKKIKTKHLFSTSLITLYEKFLQR